MSVLLFVIRVLGVLLNTIGHMTVLWIHGIIKGHTVRLGFAYRRSWARRCCQILGIKVEIVSNHEIPPGCLIVSNHRSLTDPIVQLAHMDTFVIAKNEVSKLPVIGAGAAMTGIVFVQRDKLNSRAVARKKTAEILKSGYPVLVYPEATTTTDKISARYKPGTFKVAASDLFPVVPVAIEYRDKKDYLYSGGLGRQLLRQIGYWRTHVRMSIGSPMENPDNEALLLSTKQIIDDQLVNMQEGWSRVFAK